MYDMETFMYKVANALPNFSYQPSFPDERGYVRFAGTLVDWRGMSPNKGFRRYPHLAVAIIVNGVGTYRDESGAVLPIAAGSAVRVIPGVGHLYTPDPGTTWDELYVIYEGELFQPWLASKAVRNLPAVVELPSADEAREAVTSCFEPGRSPFAVACLWLATMDDQLLGGGSRLDVASDSIVEIAKTELASNLARVTDLKEMAARLGTSYDAFRHQFKTVTGQSPYAYRFERRLKLAVDLLKMTDVGLEGIALQTGFADAFHLSSVVKRKTGLAPTLIRRRAR